MKKIFALAIVLLAMPLLGRAIPITGNLALAGLDTYTTSSVVFTSPAVVLTATGSLSIMPGTVPVNFSNIANFSNEPGQALFTWSNLGITVTMVIDSLTVDTNNQNFLNIMGRATLTETGFDPTIYAYDFTSTRPDGTTSYTMDITNNIVSEPASLLLVATGLISLASLCWVKKTCIGGLPLSKH